jgi:hypothetical protein
MSGLLCGVALCGLVPTIGAGFLARKRAARPSPESLPPGEGRGGTAATGKSSRQGGGAARSAARARTRPRRMRRILLLRWGTGGPLNGRGAGGATRPKGAGGVRARPESPLPCDRRASGDLRLPFLAKATVTRMGRDRPADRTMRPRGPLAQLRRRGAPSWAQGRAGGLARGGGRSSRPATRARFSPWAGLPMTVSIADRGSNPVRKRRGLSAPAPRGAPPRIFQGR